MSLKYSYAYRSSVWGCISESSELQSSVEGVCTCVRCDSSVMEVVVVCAFPGGGGGPIPMLRWPPGGARAGGS